MAAVESGEQRVPGPDSCTLSASIALVFELVRGAVVAYGEDRIVGAVARVLRVGGRWSWSAYDDCHPVLSLALVGLGTTAKHRKLVLKGPGSCESPISPPSRHVAPVLPDPASSLFVSAWQLIEQVALPIPHPPTLRDILHAYKSRGDGDRDMLLAMLNAKSAEDQRIAAMATLHHKLLDVHLLPERVPPHHDHIPTPAASTCAHSPHLPKIPSSAPSDHVTLPAIHAQPPRKRPRSSRSATPPKRFRSEQRVDDQPVAPSEQLPPSPPFSSPGRSTLCPELAAHPPPRDAMAIGSLLSSRSRQQDADSDWPSRTSSEREREGYRKQANVSNA
ncbi:hypothetical protein JB92DRAFT_3129400 [Gautieria morchelliformis]|nr:hypothetical protein JB92DRAFT_3129400 [Gautieria morchelliformis]